MKILFLSTENPYPPVGGHHLRTFNILKILAREHKIYFIAFAQDENEFNYIADIKKYCETVNIYPISKTGYNLGFLSLAAKNLFSRYPLVAQRYFIKEARERVKEILTRHSIDLIHVDMLALGQFRKILNQSPAILTNHNVESLRLYRLMVIARNPLIKSYLFYEYMKLRDFEKRICPQFDMCIVVSNYDKNYLENLCGTKNFAVIPNGVDIEYFKPLPEKVRRKHLVWVGGMSGPYNADAVDFFLDRIWVHIKSEEPGTTIDFIGESPTRKLREKALQDSNIKIYGFVPDIRPIVQQASVFVAPIRSGSGTKIKILNAMAQAKAVVATTNAAEGIDVIVGEHILVGDEHEDFAKKVVYLIRNCEIAENMGRMARELIGRKYSWDAIEKDIYLLYENCRKLREKENIVSERNKMGGK